MRHWLFMGLAGLTVLASACQAPPTGEDKAENQAVPVGTIGVEASDFTEYGEYYGRISGVAEAILIAVAGGPVESIEVEAGDTVAEGSSLGKVNARKARMTYEVARLNAKIARENYERATKLHKSGSNAQVTVDQSHLAWLQAEDALLDAEQVLNAALCISPISGVVVSRNIELHQQTAPGSSTFTVAQIDRLNITIGIPEMEMAGVEVGSEAEITVAMYPGQSWKGKLVRLAREVSSGALTFKAQIRCENPDRLILPGVTAKVKLAQRIHKDAIIVPTAAILDGEDGAFVMVEENGFVSRRAVRTGSSNRTHTVVLEGLSAGSNLIIEGNHLVADGVRVSVMTRS